MDDSETWEKIKPRKGLKQKLDQCKDLEDKENSTRLNKANAAPTVALKMCDL